MTRLLLFSSLTLTAVACGYEPTAKEIQAQKAAAVANSIVFDENAEIDNIKNRLELTSKPGLLGFVLLLNQSGQPIMYVSVKGKITSGSKRLTSPYGCIPSQNGGGGYICDQGLASSDEGTFGSSDPYIYFWSQSGQYYQWNGSYLYSDKPFRISVEPLVIDIQDEKSEKPE